MNSRRHLTATASAVVVLLLAGCEPKTEGLSVPKTDSPVVAEQGPPASHEDPGTRHIREVNIDLAGKVLHYGTASPTDLPGLPADY